MKKNQGSLLQQIVLALTDLVSGDLRLELAAQGASLALYEGTSVQPSVVQNVPALRGTLAETSTREVQTALYNVLEIVQDAMNELHQVEWPSIGGRVGHYPDVEAATFPKFISAGYKDSGGWVWSVLIC